jgi:hypothetical protein
VQVQRQRDQYEYVMKNASSDNEEVMCDYCHMNLGTVEIGPNWFCGWCATNSTGLLNGGR